jgi:hypothetical protein
MNERIKKLWVEALRSGKYKQGRGKLRNESNEFCCLGVLCNLHAQEHPDIAAAQTSQTEYMGSSAMPSDAVCDWAGLSIYDMVEIDGVRTNFPITMTMVVHSNESQMQSNLNYKFNELGIL